MDQATSAVRSPVALEVLASLAERPRHPYDIQRLMRERHKDFAAGKTRTLYTAVQRLHAAALIEAVETTREGHRPERTVYRITDSGRDALMAALRDLLARPQRDFPPFVVALGLAGALRPDEVALALEHRAVALEAAVAALDTTLRVATARLSLPRVVLLEVEYMVARSRAELAWSIEVAGDIRAGRLDWPEAACAGPGPTADAARAAEEPEARPGWTRRSGPPNPPSTPTAGGGT